MDYLAKIDSIITTDYESMMELEYEDADEVKAYTLDGVEV